MAWRELQAATPVALGIWTVLGASGSQLLLDGVPLEGSPAEKQFAQLLSAAGVASVQFFPIVTQDELRRFAQAFPDCKAKPAELALQLKNALRRRARNAHQRNLFHRHGRAFERHQRSRATRRRFSGRRQSGSIQAVVKRSKKIIGTHCRGTRFALRRSGRDWVWRRDRTAVRAVRRYRLGHGKPRPRGMATGPGVPGYRKS